MSRPPPKPTRTDPLFPSTTLFRSDLDDGVEGDVAVFLAARDVDLRGRDDVDVVLDDRRGVVLGQGVLEGLLATHKGPEARFEDLAGRLRSEEHTSELQSLMRISYAVFCLKKKHNTH